MGQSPPGLTWALIPLEHGVDVVSALGVGAVEGHDVDDVEDDVQKAEDERTPSVVHTVRSAADPRVHDGRHRLRKKIVINQIRTLDGWVTSADLTSMLCCPSNEK